eukprot:CAMPEP_0194201734 /NCGR_PEP_ID=MMETSP0156-20130528/1941_1 /TAXON_ID=33649 /ORGANISM="Thalassionema nitzschioides, Strain L26-B" /LENGTH=253 /DNA_ID=CAMNT_0038927019 /DNA_START=34 /DNA_END=795 /DNA_ORIENTATION=-
MTEQVSIKIITGLDGVPTKEHWDLYKAHYKITTPIKKGKFGKKKEIKLGDAFQAYRDSERTLDDQEQLKAVMESYQKNLFKKDKLKNKERVIKDLMKIQLGEPNFRVVDNENKSSKKKKVHELVMNDGVNIVNFVHKKKQDLVIVDEQDYDSVDDILNNVIVDEQDYDSDEGVIDDILNDNVNIVNFDHKKKQDLVIVDEQDYDSVDDILNNVTDEGNGLAQDEFVVKGDDDDNNKVTPQSINIHRSSSIYWC